MPLFLQSWFLIATLLTVRFKKGYALKMEIPPPTDARHSAPSMRDFGTDGELLRRAYVGGANAQLPVRQVPEPP